MVARRLQKIRIDRFEKRKEPPTFSRKWVSSGILRIRRLIVTHRGNHAIHLCDDILDEILRIESELPEGYHVTEGFDDFLRKSKSESEPDTSNSDDNDVTKDKEH